MDISTIVSKRHTAENTVIQPSIYTDLDKHFTYYTDPAIYTDPSAASPLSASTSKCCATGTCHYL